MRNKKVKQLRKLLKPYKETHDDPPEYLGNAKIRMVQIVNANGTPEMVQTDHPGTLAYHDKSYRKVYQVMKQDYKNHVS